MLRTTIFSTYLTPGLFFEKTTTRLIHGGLHDRLQVDGYVLLRVGDHHLRELSNRVGPETEIWFVTPTKWNQACISVQTFQKTGLLETTFDKGKLFIKELLN